MEVKLNRSFLEEQLSRLPKNKYNCYQWWRRYQTRDVLPKKAPLYNKIVNGDYDPSTYLYQSKMELYLLEDKLQGVKYSDEAHDIRSLFMERHRRLIHDYEKEEKQIMQNLIGDFSKTFKLDKKQLETFMETYDGTLLEMYNHFKQQTKKI
jgi:hypothetical protein